MIELVKYMLVNLIYQWKLLRMLNKHLISWMFLIAIKLIHWRSKSKLWSKPLSIAFECDAPQWPSPSIRRITENCFSSRWQTWMQCEPYEWGWNIQQSYLDRKIMKDGQSQLFNNQKLWVMINVPNKFLFSSIKYTTINN